MARRRRKGRKSSRRSRAAKRRYKRSGLYKYNQRRKRHGKKRRGHGKRKRHHGRKRHPKYVRLPKAQAQAARLQRKLARSKPHVAVLPKSELTSHQKTYLEQLRHRAKMAKVHPDWGY